MTATLLQNIAAGLAPPLRSFTGRDVQAMLNAGILMDGDPIELIDGLLVYKDRRDPGMEDRPLGYGIAHAAVISRLSEKLSRNHSAAEWHVRLQLPVELGESQILEPDASFVRGAVEDFDVRHPGPKDLLAVLEVSGASLRYDRTTRLRVYARAGVPIVLIVNLETRQVEIYASPSVDRYDERMNLSGDESFRLDLPGVDPLEIAVTDVLPGAPPR